MFKVERPSDAPECTKRTGYNTKEIVEALHKIFHGKCYLCEKDKLQDPEIEHFIPHGATDELKYEWTNLFYSCGRCNSIKSSTHTNLIDCTKDTEARTKIKHFVPSSPSLPAIVLPVDLRDQQSLNTARLLDECFNLANTAIRGITRASFFEQLTGEYLQWLRLRKKIVSKRSTPAAVQEATLQLKEMLRIDYPYSVFWYWHTVSDPMLIVKVEHIVN